MTKGEEWRGSGRGQQQLSFESLRLFSIKYLGIYFPEEECSNN
jgi:hypothetical protein